MVWLYPVGDTFTVFFVKPDLEGLIEVESLPEGSGILRRAEDGTFYYEPYPEVTDPPIIEQPTEPPKETQPPVLSVEEMQAQILLNTEYLVSRTELGL